jgi:hypothetical protein
MSPDLRDIRRTAPARLALACLLLLAALTLLASAPALGSTATTGVSPAGEAAAGGAAAPSGPSTVATTVPTIATTTPTIATSTPATTPGTVATPGTTTPSPTVTVGGTTVPRSQVLGTLTLTKKSDDGKISDGAILAAVLAGLIALACLIWGIFRITAFEPHWLLSARHSVAEAGFRAAGTWDEFTDWLRIGH